MEISYLLIIYTYIKKKFSSRLRNTSRYFFKKNIKYYIIGRKLGRPCMKSVGNFHWGYSS